MCLKLINLARVYSQEKKRIVCMLVLIVALFTISWFPFFSIQLYLVVEPEVHRIKVVRMTVAILQLVGYRYISPVVFTET